MYIYSDLYPFEIGPLKFVPTKHRINTMSAELRKYVVEPIYFLNIEHDPPLKRNGFEVSIITFLYQLIEVINQGIETKNKSTVTIYDYEEEITFNIRGSLVDFSLTGNIDLGTYNLKEILETAEKNWKLLRTIVRYV